MPGLRLGNLVAIVVLPFLLATAGIGLPGYLAGTGAAGFALIVAEDPGYARKLWRRRDVRTYVAMRVVLTALAGIVPYLVGRLVAAG